MPSLVQSTTQRKVSVYSGRDESKSLISSSERKLCKRRVLATSAVPPGAAHSLSLQLSSLCEQFGMHVAATSDKSLNDAMILFGSRCAKPNARIPGVSIAQPPAGSKSGESGSAIALEDV